MLCIKCTSISPTYYENKKEKNNDDDEDQYVYENEHMRKSHVIKISCDKNTKW